MKLYKLNAFLSSLLITSCSVNLEPQSSVNDPNLPTIDRPSPNNQAQEQVKYNIRQQTVQITGKSTGTGIIVGREGNKYYVLTAKHVVAIAPSKNVELPKILGPDEKGLTNQEDPYKVITYDGQTYDVIYDEVEKDPDIDLAIIKFDTTNQSKIIYPVANLATSPISKDQKVFVYGFKDCFNKGRKESEEFNDGRILSIKKTETDTETDKEYTINYTNYTMRGMSGGPVLDITGRVIALHGKPGITGKGDSPNCSALTKEFGNNYGISITTFKNSILASRLRGKLSFDNNSVTTDISESEKNNNKLNNSPGSPVHFRKSQN